MRGSRSRESFFCLEQQGKPPVGKKFVLDLEGRVGFAKAKKGNRGTPGRERGLSKGQKERNHSQICTSGSLSSLPNVVAMLKSSEMGHLLLYQEGCSQGLL